MNLKAPLVVTIIALASAGCTSGTTTSRTSATTSSSASSQPSHDVAADKTLAVAANLKLADLPTGWTEKPGTSSSSDDAIAQELASCLHTSVQLFNHPNSKASADSPDFSDSNGNSASSRVTYEAEASLVRQRFAVLQDSKFPSCYDSAIRAEIENKILHPTNPSDTLPKGASVGAPAVAQMSFPPIGDQSIAFRVTLPIQYNGLTIDGYFDLVAIQKGRTVALMNFNAVSSPFDSSMEVRLSTLTAGRLTDT